MNVIYTSVTSKNNYLLTEMKILMKKKKNCYHKLYDCNISIDKIKN